MERGRVIEKLADRHAELFAAVAAVARGAAEAQRALAEQLAAVSTRSAEQVGHRTIWEVLQVLASASQECPRPLQLYLRPSSTFPPPCPPFIPPIWYASPRPAFPW